MQTTATGLAGPASRISTPSSRKPSSLAVWTTRSRTCSSRRSLVTRHSQGVVDLHPGPPLDQLAELLHVAVAEAGVAGGGVELVRSEEHTSELQSRVDLVCRLL